MGEWYDIIANNVSASILQEHLLKYLPTNAHSNRNDNIISTLDQIKVRETKDVYSGSI